MKKLFYLVVALVIVGGVYWYMSNDSGQPAGNNEEEEEEQEEQVKPNPSPADNVEEGNELQGTLKASNDNKRGNIILEVSDSDRVIYMTTSRDFSNLYEKEVVVTIDGDLTGFTLVDIKEA